MLVGLKSEDPSVLAYLNFILSLLKLFLLLIFFIFIIIIDQCGFLSFKYFHWPNEKLGSIKFKNINACLFLDKVAKAHACGFKE